ncbi:MAG: hypothetical protein NC123_11500 [Butyrivibrio sp.]|nr:hypothetical protein [Acetatifactor muris]MCM1560149.1 hypothetical protein [Butyrivibrio sp.]
MSLCKATISQTAFLLKRKEAVSVFYVLLLMVAADFIGNVLYFQGRDRAMMVQPMRLLLLSYDRTNLNADNTLLLILLYPLLVVCPAGFSFVREQQLGVGVYFVSRQGRAVYHTSRLLSAFLTTMLVFTAPFLLEILLNCISFPLSATGNLANLSAYDSEYINGINRYLMKNIYLASPYLYAVAGTLLFGAVSGLLGAFTLAVSSFVRVRYRILLFLPVFVLLNLSAGWPGSLRQAGPSIKWYDYLLLFNNEAKNTGFGAAVVLALLLFSVIAARVGGRKDCLQ